MNPPAQFPLPWKHVTDGDRMTAVVAANGRLICGSLVCMNSAPDRWVHAWIVAQSRIAAHLEKVKRSGK